MTTQHQIIAICIIAAIAVPLGTFTAIKTINKLMRPPVNSLLRTHDGDIELNYIEPTRPGQIYNYPDLVTPTYERISFPPSYETGVIPSYRSGTLPIYQSMEGLNINCCLENENIFYYDFIFPISMIIFALIKILKINSIYNISILIPFSLFNIDFRDSFEWKFNSWKVKPKISYLKLQSLTKDINSLLLSLVDDENYSMSLSFISSYKEWENNKWENQPLLIDDAIIINKESDSLLISQFIMENLDKKGYFISNWLFNDQSLNLMDPVILIVTVAIKVKI